jgi:hypothetical protein
MILSLALMLMAAACQPGGNVGTTQVDARRLQTVGQKAVTLGAWHSPTVMSQH